MAEPARGLRVAEEKGASRAAPIERSGGAERFERLADWLLLAVVFFVLGASYKTTEVLTVGDWNM
ncbi:MAG: hypothetical protein ACREQ9_14595, partial [Candidatus Binatia bacterium]